MPARGCNGTLAPPLETRRKDMQLFHLPASCSSAVMATLTLTGEPFTTEIVDLKNRSEAFRRANPLPKVPALADDGGAMFEGGAINLWLRKSTPRPG